MNFDRSKLTNQERMLLLTFHERRKTINNYIEQHELDLAACPGCGGDYIKGDTIFYKEKPKGC